MKIGKRADFIGMVVIAAESALVIVALRLSLGGLEWRGKLALFLIVDALLSAFALWLWKRPRTYRNLQQYRLGIGISVGGLMIAVVCALVGLRGEPVYWLIALFAVIGFVLVAGYARLWYAEREMKMIQQTLR